MKIWHITSTVRGGAGSAARRVHESVLSTGVESLLWSLDDAPIAPNIRTVNQTGVLRRALRSVACRINPAPATVDGLDFYRNPWFPGPRPWQVAGELPDVLHLHWLQGWLPFSNVDANALSRVPIVISLHDTFLFTGGCIYPWGCDRYKARCGTCPQLKLRGERDVSRSSMLRKQAFFGKLKYSVTAPSTWMLDLARQSPIFANAISFTHVPYGIDSQAYRPVDRDSARASLGIHGDTFVVGFGAASGTTDIRKGFLQLDQALRHLAERARKKVTLLTFGGEAAKPYQLGGYETFSLGHIGSPLLQSVVYSACDYFVVPSLEDNSPQVAIESQACGTPCIVFDSGGLCELLVSDSGGVSVPRADVEALAEALRSASERATRSSSERHALAGRASVTFSMASQGAKYLDIYTGLMQRR